MEYSSSLCFCCVDCGRTLRLHAAQFACMPWHAVFEHAYKALTLFQCAIHLLVMKTACVHAGRAGSDRAWLTCLTWF